jgi:hypothetical protein
MLRWFRQLATAFTAPKPTSVSVSFAGIATMAGDLRVDLVPRPGATLAERVSILEEKLKHLRDELDTKIQGVRREVDTVKKSVERESQERRVGDEKMAREIEEVAIGGLHLEVVGLIWLFLGIMASGIPDVVTWLAHGLVL